MKDKMKWEEKIDVNEKDKGIELEDLRKEWRGVWNGGIIWKEEVLGKDWEGELMERGLKDFEDRRE